MDNTTKVVKAFTDLLNAQIKRKDELEDKLAIEVSQLNVLQGRINELEEQIENLYKAFEECNQPSPKESALH